MRSSRQIYAFVFQGHFKNWK